MHYELIMYQIKGMKRLMPGGITPFFGLMPGGITPFFGLMPDGITPFCAVLSSARPATGMHNGKAIPYG